LRDILLFSLKTLQIGTHYEIFHLVSLKEQELIMN